MKKACILSMLLMLTSSVLTPAQTPRSASAAASKSWQQFWGQFTQAVKKGDRSAVRNMMSDDFSDNGGGVSADDWAKTICSRQSNREYLRQLALGTVPFKYNRRPARIIKGQEAGALIFEFGKDGRWRWAGLLGD